MTEFGRVITQNEHNLHNGNFQFIESAAQILRRKKQRIAFREKRTIYIENPLKSYDSSGFSGPSDWFRTSGLVVPNHALYHLSYTRNCGNIITDMAGKSKGKIRGGNLRRGKF